jgi:hypothetical protein
VVVRQEAILNNIRAAVALRERPSP